MALPSIKNSVGMAVTAVADAGVGTLTVGAALSGGYQTAATAYGADANIDIRVDEGDTWEVCRDCAYDHSELTVTRGTQEDGSSGPSTRVAFTSAAKVYVVESAERMRRTVGGYLEHASHDGSAAVTGVVGTLHVFTGLTADRVFTLPAAAVAGDRIGVTFPAGSASYEILLKSASGDKINNVDCSTTEWSRLFIAGEIVIFRCIDASTVDWVVEQDGRRPAIYTGTYVNTTAAGSTDHKYDFSAVTPDINYGFEIDATNDRVYMRRGGKVSITARILTLALTDQKATWAGQAQDGGGLGYVSYNASSGTNNISGDGVFMKEKTAGQYFECYFGHTDTSALQCYNRILLQEVL